MHVKNFEGKPVRKIPKRTISANGGLELLHRLICGGCCMNVIGSSRDGERRNRDSSSSEGADGANEQDSERARLNTFLT